MKAEGQQQTQQDDDSRPKQLPKGVVLGPDGKPCRSCTSFASWAAMTKQQQQPPTSKPTTIATPQPPAQSVTALQPPQDCPPDVEQLGRSSWTLLHSMAATYPERPTANQQTETKQFLTLFSRMYPCWVCADDFRTWMTQGNEPRVSNRDEFGRWMCEAHNAVNVKLGKESFDCNRWEERWRTGWRDGRCE
ncbi:hypothetical protein BAUCODRAFT_71192 [Baudoinia panamericana UAMH 10762]|uniref:Sulfhydryl oxidase n=1 Tax=Baudoinia panamericana (strain UAMH 10762) TaxID=717646 RepID=M2LNT4_BAUPA|nr:uncharacterized protein BAUCODRAFT_71192 [Baudoinia panamericana UAMH 10762]EMC96012.1 hypothetical protein BAUCODRAFT_71192 [Baudoinia panamericana UAMH 10762]